MIGLCVALLLLLLQELARSCLCCRLGVQRLEELVGVAGAFRALKCLLVSQFGFALQFGLLRGVEGTEQDGVILPATFVRSLAFLAGVRGLHLLTKEYVLTFAVVADTGKTSG